MQLYLGLNFGKMDGAQFVLLGIPLFLFCSDVINLFTQPPPPPPRPPPPPKHLFQPPLKYQPNYQLFRQHQQQLQHFNFPSQKTSSIGSGIGVGSIVKINFCTSCSYRGHAVTMKNMLEAAFPGIHVVFGNHTPIMKSLMSKVVTVFQVGIIVIIMAGEHIFLRLGYSTPPPWYYSLRANRYGTIVSTWLFGNFIQSYLQRSGAFEVFCNGELIFSKLMEYRFPSEFELRELVSGKLYDLQVDGGLGGGLWS